MPRGEAEALYAVVPRYAERREEVKEALEKEGFEVVLRSAFHAPRNPAAACFVIDSTGELRDWTAHADLVVDSMTELLPLDALLARWS